MNKQLLLLLCVMLFGATKVWAAVGDVFTANVEVVSSNGTTTYVPMRFQVESESSKTCRTYGEYDRNSHTSNPTIRYDIEGKVTVPETVNGYTVDCIGDYSFVVCKSITGITLPNSIRRIGSYAFLVCESLKEFDLPDGVEYLGDAVYKGCIKLERAGICNTINWSCFYECYNLRVVEFKTPVEIVDENAFGYCRSLESIFFPAGLKSVGEISFRDCTNLKSIFLPSTLTSIGQATFLQCQNLEKVTIASETPPSVASDSFNDLPSNAVLYVPDRTKYNSAPWTSWFSEIKSFLPTVELTVNTWFNYSVGLTWPLSYTENYSASDVLDLVIDGKPTVPEVWEGYSELIVSKDPKHIPQEVSFLLKTSEGLVPYKLHYNVKEYGFSINGKEMTSVDMYDIPGLVSGDAYLAVKLNAPDYPTLVLDNAVLEWDAVYGLYNHDVYQDGLTIKVIGDCSINAPKGLGFELDIATNTTITGGGTLRIQSQGSAFRCWIATTLTIQDNTTVIANSTGTSAFYDEDGANLEIKDGGTFAAYSNSEPIYLDSNGKFILGEGIGVRYPAGAYFGDWCFYYADGTRVKNDWIIIGPAGSEDLIDGLTSSFPRGDVNLDKTVDIADAVCVLNAMAGQSVAGDANVNGDYDDDGNPVIDIADLVTVLNIMAGR